MVRIVILVALLASASPAAAIHIVQVSGAAGEARPDVCARPANFTAAATDNEPAATEDAAQGVGSGSVIAGLVGILVLGMVFGRRRSGLPEVVS